MANTRELRRRIKSVKNTAQITKAMQMVAATKMRKAQSQALLGRPYKETLDQSLARLISKIEIESHPLLMQGKGQNNAALLLSTDKSLCGALNTNLFRLIQFAKELTGTSFYTIGSKGRNFVVKSGKKLEADFENSEIVQYSQARVAAKGLINSFLAGEIKEAYLIYPHFISTLKQEPKIVKILPINPDVSDTNSQSGLESEYLLEPNADDLLEFVLNHHVEVSIYQALLETKASEHSARMIAMQNATDNALELVDDLNLEYNQTRQNSITQELLEITSAGAALN